jgi:tetratricopeptide (TPR) repeat protein
LKNILNIVIFITVTFSALFGKSGDIDHMALATLMIQDENWERAKISLDEVDKSKKDFNFGYYYTLRGMVSMKLQDYKTAIVEFEEAIKNGQNDQNIYLYLIEANYKIKDYANTVYAIERGGSFAKGNPQLFSIKADSLWKIDRQGEAIETLSEGFQLFPKSYEFLKQKFFYLVSLYLYQSAIEVGNEFIKISEPSADTMIAMASALQKSGEFGRAIYILEKALLLFPKNPKISALLSHIYIKLEKIYTSASLMERASIFDGKYLTDGSEMYRRAGAFSQSIYLNSQILDRKEKLKQRLSIYLEFGDFERAVAMEDSMERSGLLKENEDIRYALAYALYMTGDFQNCEKHLKKPQRGDLFAKGIELRKNIQKCNEDMWSCP